MAKTYKCRASHCFHDSKDILPDDDIVKIKNAAYHKDCYQAISDIREVIDIFATKINPNVVFSELRKVINTIVYDRKIDSGMLLYGVKYYLKNNIPLNYPQGLYYVVQNKEVQDRYKKIVTAFKVKDYQFTAPVDESQSFEYKTKPQKGFADILSGE